MAGQPQPLVNTTAIVTKDGTPTEYFIRWAQNRQEDIKGSVTVDQAHEIISQFAADHVLHPGLGISLTPDGNIEHGVTIAADIQALLDHIASAQGTLLYRSATGWTALAPGSAGQFLQTAGPAANPLWAAAGGGTSFAFDGGNASTNWPTTGVFKCDLGGAT